MKEKLPARIVSFLLIFNLLFSSFYPILISAREVEDAGGGGPAPSEEATPPADSAQPDPVAEVPPEPAAPDQPAPAPEPQGSSESTAVAPSEPAPTEPAPPPSQPAPPAQPESQTNPSSAPVFNESRTIQDEQKDLRAMMRETNQAIVQAPQQTLPPVTDSNSQQNQIADNQKQADDLMTRKEKTLGDFRGSGENTQDLNYVLSQAGDTVQQGLPDAFGVVQKGATSAWINLGSSLTNISSQPSYQNDLAVGQQAIKEAQDKAAAQQQSYQNDLAGGLNVSQRQQQIDDLTKSLGISKPSGMSSVDPTPPNWMNIYPTPGIGATRVTGGQTATCVGTVDECAEGYALVVAGMAATAGLVVTAPAVIPVLATEGSIIAGTVAAGGGLTSVPTALYVYVTTAGTVLVTAAPRVAQGTGILAKAGDIVVPAITFLSCQKTPDPGTCMAESMTLGVPGTSLESALTSEERTLVRSKDAKDKKVLDVIRGGLAKDSELLDSEAQSIYVENSNILKAPAPAVLSPDQLQSEFQNKVQMAIDNVIGSGKVNFNVKAQPNALFNEVRVMPQDSGGVKFLATMESANDGVPPLIEDIDVGILKQQGLGSAIVRSWEETLAKNGNNIVGIAHVRAEAMDFWRKMGYEPALNLPDYSQIWLKPLNNVGREAIDTSKAADVSEIHLHTFIDRMRVNEAISQSLVTSGGELGSVHGISTKKTSFLDRLIKKTVYASDHGTDIRVTSADSYELLVKKNAIKFILRKRGRIDNSTLKQIVSADVLASRVIRTDEGYELITDRQGISGAEVGKGRFKVETDLLSGVDVKIPDIVDTNVNSLTVILVAVKKGSGKVDKIAYNVQDKRNTSASGSANVKLVVFSDTNGNGKLDSDEKVLPWAGIRVKLTNVDQQKQIPLLAGWNLVTLNALPDSALTASKLLGQIASQGGYATTVSTLVDGTWKSYVQRGDKSYSDPAEDFTIEPGKAYFVKSLKKSTLTFTGQALVYPIKLKLSSGWNAVGLPFMSKSYKASDLPSNTAARWESGLWDTFVKSNKEEFGENFPIENSRGYILKLEQGREFSP